MPAGTAAPCFSPPLKGTEGGFNLFVGTRRAVSADFNKTKICFRINAYSVGNVPPERFQNRGTASGTQGGAVLFAPPSKSCRFSHPPSPCAKSTAQGISLSADSDSGGSSPPENLPPAALSWSSLTNPTTSFLSVPARYTLLSAFVETRRAVSASFSKGKSVENVPPERFQNCGTASGIQGGAVLFAPPSKSCRFSHPPSPCAESMAQRISPSADGDLEGTCPLRTPRQLRSAGAA